MQKIFSVLPDEIKNILNPFENNYSEADNVISVEEIINPKELFPFKNNIKEQIIRKTLVLLANPQDISYVTFNFEKSNKESFVIENIENLYASMILNKPIKFNVVGDINYCKKLFKEMLEEEALPENNNFDWGVDSNLLEDTWNNVGYMLKKITDSSYKEKEEIFRTLDKKIWSVREFIDGVAEIESPGYFLSFVPSEIFFTDNFFDAIKYNEDVIVDYMRICVLSFNKSKSKKFIRKACNEILSNGSIFAEVLNKEKRNSLSDFKDFIKTIEVINKNIFNNKELIYGVESNLLTYIYDSLSEEFFKDEENCIRFLEEMSSCFLSDTKLINWLDDKKKVLYYLSKYDLSNVSHILYKRLSPEMKQDSELVSAFIESDPSLYFNLSAEIRYDVSIAKTFFLNWRGSDSLPFKDDLLQKIMNEDENFFVGICMKYPDIILNKWCDNKFHKVSIVKLLSENNIKQLQKNTLTEKIRNPERSKWMDKSIHQFLEMVCKNENDYVELVSGNTSFYDYLPTDKKNNIDVVIGYVTNLKYFDANVMNKLLKVPTQLLFNKKVAMAIVEHSNSLNFIPEEFLSDKKFMVEVFKKVDRKEIELQNIPTKIVQFFEAFKITSNYGQFLESYLHKIELDEKIKPRSNKKKLII